MLLYLKKKKKRLIAPFKKVICRGHRASKRGGGFGRSLRGVRPKKRQILEDRRRKVPAVKGEE